MKIRKIRLKNYKIFDNLDLDFTDNEGKTLETIILAGINGCGKTTLLQLISQIFSEGSNKFRLSTSIPLNEFTSDTDSILCDRIAIEIELSNSTHKAFQELLNNYLMSSQKINTTDDRVSTEISRILKKFNKKSKFLTFEYELRIDNDQVTIVKNDFLLFAILSSKKFSQLAKIAYFISYASDFYKKNNKMNINNALSKRVNGRESEILEDGIVSYIDAFTNKGEVSQYIAKSVIEKLLANKEVVVKEALQQSVELLNSPLIGINLTTKLIGIEDDEPIFESFNGKKVKLKELSAGEKNLFYRSSYLKMMNLNESILLIDEPEVSLHPAWQQKILGLYKNAGRNNQVVIATHSPFILSSVEPKSLFLLFQDTEANYMTVLNMERDSQQPSKGLEPNRVLTEIMGLEYLRDAEIQEKINLMLHRMNQLRIKVNADLLDDAIQEYERKQHEILVSVNALEEVLGINDVEIVRMKHQLYVINKLLMAKKKLLSDKKN